MQTGACTLNLALLAEQVETSSDDKEHFKRAMWPSTSERAVRRISEPMEASMLLAQNRKIAKTKQSKRARSTKLDSLALGLLPMWLCIVRAYIDSQFHLTCRAKVLDSHHPPPRLTHATSQLFSPTRRYHHCSCPCSGLLQVALNANCQSCKRILHPTGWYAPDRQGQAWQRDRHVQASRWHRKGRMGVFPFAEPTRRDKFYPR